MSAPIRHHFTDCSDMRPGERPALYRAAVTCRSCIDGMHARGLMPTDWTGGAR